MRTILSAIVLFFLSTASAQALCAERDEIIDKLESSHSEEIVGLGIASGFLVELLTSKDGSTWSIVITYPTGRSCVVAVGEDWRAEKVGVEL